MTVAERGPHGRNRHLTFRANAGVGRHGWLRLTPAYGVRLVRERIAHLPEGSVVTDPFCGSGTTPLAAVESGHIGQGVDVNPFLVWLGRVKTAHYSGAELAAADDAVSAVVAAARRLLGRDDLWQPGLFRIERWWGPGSLGALRALRAALDDSGGLGGSGDLLEVALCRALIARSNAAFNHQSMSLGNRTDAPTPSDPDREAAETLAAFEAEGRTVVGGAGDGLPGGARIVHGDARRALEGLRPCDLLLTSPPYVNRMSYIRELRPYMYWLRYLDRAADAGELDWRAVGGSWGTATSRLTSWEPETDTPVDALVEPVCAAIAADGGRNGPLLATYVRRYFHDMWLHLRAAAAHVRPGGSVCYIVGNSVFYGHLVPAQEWYAVMLRALGFADVEVATVRKRNSNKALYEYEVRGVRPGGTGLTPSRRCGRAGWPGVSAAP
ncbi:TRM11 family methyltransferase [Thermobifida halotolerans]|uniref:DNA methyltransferase n=1 Tax=Thermobifida halotolerans TaxID=483545 RepID=UPI000837F8CA|nr:DNA methyltransferase [Thermobifida halotolerans]